MVERLPTFIKEAKNREAILKILQKMEKLIQITSGRGPLECQWVVAKVLKVFLEEAKDNNIDYEIIHRENGDENLTLKSVTLLLQSKNLNEFLDNWLGSICWIGKSTFRKLHKRSNWFIGVFELEGLEKINFNEKDIQFQTTRSQGSGGQNVNKVNTAVRATHIPTGQSVFVQDSRSQLENKKLSIERLKAKVLEQNIIQLQKRMQETWNNHLNVQRGNPIRTFSGTDLKRIIRKNLSKTEKSTEKRIKKLQK
jgi:peptide chain release factor